VTPALALCVLLHLRRACGSRRAIHNLHFGVGPKSPEWSKHAFGLAPGCALDSPRRLTSYLGRIGGMDGSRP